MPNAVESGRVKLQGSLILTTVSMLAQLTLDFPSPRLLYATTCTARGCLCLPRFQNIARLVRRVLSHHTETSARCRWAKDPVGHG